MTIHFRGFFYDITFTERAWGESSYTAVESIELIDENLTDTEREEGEDVLEVYRDDIEQIGLDYKEYDDDII